MNKTRRNLLAVTAALVALVALTASATAARPLTIEIDETFPEVAISCPGLDEGELLFSLKGLVNIIATPKQEIVAVASHFVVTWSGNGKSLSSTGSTPVMITYDAQGNVVQVKLPGLLGAATIPGHGVVLLSTGLLIFDGPAFEGQITVVRGPHEGLGLEGDDLEAFCAYFEAA
jgi:hypothetical protein